MFWRMRYAARAEEGAGGAGAGTSGDGGSGGAAGAAAVAGAGAGSAAAGTGVTPAGGAGSALAAGAGAAPAGTPAEWLPEKYRTNKEDGSVDVEASARKLAEAHGSLEKRIGDIGVAPKTADEYVVTVPDALKDAFKLDEDQMYKDFRANMHGLGLTQKQFEGVMSKYFEAVPALVAGGAQVTTEGAEAALRGVWKDESSYKSNVGLAFTAADTVAKMAGLSFDDLEKAGLSNNPTFIRVMAAIGPEFKEGTSLSQSGGGALSNESEINGLMQSEANSNPKHPNHKETRAKIDAYYARKFGNTPVY